VEYLYGKGLLSEKATYPKFEDDYGDIGDDEFDRIVDTMQFFISPYIRICITSGTAEIDTIPENRDIIIFRHPRYMKVQLHVHNYYEIVFVAKGHVKFFYDSVSRILDEGAVFIISPSCEHDILVDDESIIFTIFIKPTTFNTTYFPQLSQKNPSFMQGKGQFKYILFFTKDSHIIKRYIHQMMIETNRHDIYANARCLSYFNLLFSELLRSFGGSIQLEDLQEETDFSQISQYIQHNYKTITLSTLAQTFHYSEPHMCTLIKQNTGYTLTEIIKQLRLSNAVKYLNNTNMRIGEIAEHVGYKSADHFSRVFRVAYNVSPQEYRRQHGSK
jgi:AraC-like DNA-binding protein